MTNQNIPTFKDQMELVRLGLAKYSDHNGIRTFKYSKQVMYSNLWGTNGFLMECRGHCYEIESGNLLALPPRKTFNWKENNAGSLTNRDTEVLAHKKYNGFMACASNYNGELLVSTTGTTSSSFAEMAKSMLISRGITAIEGVTSTYEIIHPEDPHVVNEEIGVKLLGFRNHPDINPNSTGFYPFPSESPEDTFNGRFGDLIKSLETCKHEGWMVYSQTGEVFKLKSPYYLSKKKLMRMPPAKVLKFFKEFDKVMKDELQWFPDYMKVISQKIIREVWIDDWITCNDQQRRGIIEEYEKELVVYAI